MQFFRDSPRWLLLTILALAPWVYGSTRPWSVELLKWELLVLTGLSALSFLVARRKPCIPGGLAILMLLALGWGWWMTGNARAIFDPVGSTFHEIKAWAAFLPGTMDQQRSVSSMLLITGMMGAFGVAVDMLSEPKWRDRLWLVIALTGTSMILLGIVQRLSGAPSIFWVAGEKIGSTFFATYRYHANAGAFINLVLPFVWLRTLWVLRSDRAQWRKAAWTLASVVGISAAFLNVSRAAMAITVILLFVLAVWWLLFERKAAVAGSRSWWVGPLSVAIAVGLLVYSFGIDRTIQHWLHPRHNNDLMENLRYQVYDIVWNRTLPFLHWSGSGPGTFELIFPLSVAESGNRAVGQWYWVNAHQDYLQTLVEWGVMGSVFWWVLLVGGFVLVCSRLLLSHFHIRTEARYPMVAAALALLGVGLHSMVDFPLQIASLQLYTAVSCAIAWTVGAKSTEGATGRRRRRRKSGLSKMEVDTSPPCE